MADRDIKYIDLVIQRIEVLFRRLFNWPLVRLPPVPDFQSPSLSLVLGLRQPRKICYPSISCIVTRILGMLLFWVFADGNNGPLCDFTHGRESNIFFCLIWNL
jgi:hypothetical protein